MNVYEKLEKEERNLYDTYFSNFNIDGLIINKSDKFSESLAVSNGEKQYRLCKNIYGGLLLYPMNELDRIISFNANEKGIVLEMIEKDDVLRYINYQSYIDDKGGLISKYECSTIECDDLEYTILEKDNVFDKKFIDTFFPNKTTSIVVNDEDKIYGTVFSNKTIDEVFEFWKNIKNYRLECDNTLPLYEINRSINKEPNKIK